MIECLNCGIQFQERRSTAKFCSNKCRAAFSRKKVETSQESILAKVLLVQDEMTETLLKIKQLVANTPYNAPRLPDNFIGDEPLHPMNLKPVLSYNQAWDMIDASTSSTELENAWRRIKKQEWPVWQMKQLEGLKNIQQTKIDF